MSSEESVPTPAKKCKSKEKRPQMFFTPQHKLNRALNAIELQKMLGLCLFAQQYKSWPKWISVVKPLLLKSVVVVEYEGQIGELPESGLFADMFDKDVSFFSPSNYESSWEFELLNIPSSYLTPHAREMAYQKKAITTPVGPKRAADHTFITLSNLVSNRTEKEARLDALQTDPKVPFPMPELLSDDLFDRTLLLLNTEQMILEKVPMPREEAGSSWIPEWERFIPLKEKYEPVGPHSPMFALDCEMVLTKAGSELARVTMVDETGCVLLDKLVKPYNPVENYLTKYSGITREILADIDTRLEDVQKELSALLPPDAILVGHSINNDLKALQVIHPYIIDTSVIYNMSQVRQGKPRLRNLTSVFLGKTIQSGHKGHSSAEDAKATMDLVRLKLSQSLEFGDTTTSWRFPSNYLNGSNVNATTNGSTAPESTNGNANPTTKPSLGKLAELKARGALTVPKTLRPYLDFLTRVYTDPSQPLHLVERLLADLKVPTCVRMDSDQSGTAPAFTRPGKKAIKWVVEAAQTAKFVMTRIGRPESWTREREREALTEFATRVYMQLRPYTLFLVICSGYTRLPSMPDPPSRYSKVYMAITDPAAFSGRFQAAAVTTASSDE